MNMETSRGNKNSFKTPSNYFENLEDSILSETKQFGKVNGFDVPEGYFEQLEDKLVLGRKKRGNMRVLWASISSVAACLVVGVSVFYFMNDSADISVDSYAKFSNSKTVVDEKVEDAVYESLYKSYFVDDEHKKSSNEITLDDLDNFYSEQQLSSSY